MSNCIMSHPLDAAIDKRIRRESDFPAEAYVSKKSSP